MPASPSLSGSFFGNFTKLVAAKRLQVEITNYSTHPQQSNRQQQNRVARTDLRTAACFLNVLLNPRAAASRLHTYMHTHVRCAEPKPSYAQKLIRAVPFSSLSLKELKSAEFIIDPSTIEQKGFFLIGLFL